MIKKFYNARDYITYVEGKNRYPGTMRDERWPFAWPRTSPAAGSKSDMKLKRNVALGTL